MHTERRELGPILITAEEAADLLGVSRQTIYSWARKGVVPFYRVGKRLIKFDKDELFNSFKVEQSASLGKLTNGHASVRPISEPFGILEREISPDLKKQRERYRAMMGMVR